MVEKIPGWVGLCSQCKRVVRVPKTEIDLKEGESLAGYICVDCSNLIKEEGEPNDL